MDDRIELTSQHDPNELPPPVTLSRPSLSRQSTWTGPFISSQPADEDQFDAWLPRKVSPDTLKRSLSAETKDPDMQRLMNDYSDFKSQPSRKFFHDVVSVSAFNLPSTRTIHYPPSQDVASEKPFSDCMEDLNLALKEDAGTDCVRTWYNYAKYSRGILC